MRFISVTSALLLTGAVVASCSDRPAPLDNDRPDARFAVGPVVHHASAGGGDACSQGGCDANFSLVANQHADGSVSGQWQDTWYGGTPIHVTLDCLYVTGNEAWVSGVVTGPVYPGFPVIARVVDNGTSANDTRDQISWLLLDSYGGCTAAPDLPIYDMIGQVKVW